MKKIFFLSIITMFSLSIGLLTGCTTQPKNNTQPSLQTTPSAPATLTTEQISALTFIIQEEKLARDVYLSLYNKRGIKKFYNILQAEENHQAQVAKLLAVYNIENPVLDKDIGEFTDDSLQKLYTTLIDQGMSSSAEAINVGIAIEEKDIGDIELMLSSFTAYSDITQTLKNLLAGSKKHLTAFQK